MRVTSLAIASFAAAAVANPLPKARRGEGYGDSGHPVEPVKPVKPANYGSSDDGSYKPDPTYGNGKPMKPSYTSAYVYGARQTYDPIAEKYTSATVHAHPSKPTGGAYGSRAEYENKGEHEHNGEYDPSYAGKGNGKYDGYTSAQYHGAYPTGKSDPYGEDSYGHGNGKYASYTSAEYHGAYPTHKADPYGEDSYGQGNGRYAGYTSAQYHGAYPTGSGSYGAASDPYGHESHGQDTYGQRVQPYVYATPSSSSVRTMPSAPFNPLAMLSNLGGLKARKLGADKVEKLATGTVDKATQNIPGAGKLPGVAKRQFPNLPLFGAGNVKPSSTSSAVYGYATADSYHHEDSYDSYKPAKPVQPEYSHEDSHDSYKPTQPAKPVYPVHEDTYEAKPTHPVKPTYETEKPSYDKRDYYSESTPVVKPVYAPVETPAYVPVKPVHKTESPYETESRHETESSYEKRATYGAASNDYPSKPAHPSHDEYSNEPSHDNYPSKPSHTSYPSKPSHDSYGHEDNYGHEDSYASKPSHDNYGHEDSYASKPSYGTPSYNAPAAPRYPSPSPSPSRAATVPAFPNILGGLPLGGL